MSEQPDLPRAARTLVAFVSLLRVNGFAVAPEQTIAFLAAIDLLGPRRLEDIRQAGLATLAPPPERRAAYDRLFQLHFLGSEEVAGAEGDEDEVVRLQEEGRGQDEPPLADDSNESGAMATRGEALVERRFGPDSASDALRRSGPRCPCPPATPARPSPHARAARPMGGPAADFARGRP